MQSVHCAGIFSLPQPTFWAAIIQLCHKVILLTVTLWSCIVWPPNCWNTLLDHVHVSLLYAVLQGMWVSDCPHSTNSLSLLTTPYHSDLVMCNKENNSVTMLELTCPLDLVKHLEAARKCKQGKKKYQEIMSEFEHVGVACYYNTLELSVLGHYTCHCL